MSKHALGVDPVLRTHDELKVLAEAGAAELGWDAPGPRGDRLGGAQL